MLRPQSTVRYVTWLRSAREPCALTCHNTKVSVILQMVGLLTNSKGDNSQRVPFLLVGPQLLGPRCCLSLACAPHVRLLIFINTIVSLEWVLTEAISVAIWGKDLVAAGIATGIWGINSAFLILGGSLSHLQATWKSDCVLGVCRVNKSF